MEQLSPHIIMRRGLIEGRRYPHAARHVGDYIARASFFTSDLAIPLEQKFAGVADFANNLALRRITAELVFTDPYRVMERNRWTSPELDDVAARIRADGPLKIAAARRGHQFLASSQALIHGDLHTGSVMVTETRHARHRSRIRGLRADRLRPRRLPRQSADELLFAARPRHRRGRPPRPAAMAARTDPDFLAELCRSLRAAVARTRPAATPIRRDLFAEASDQAAFDAEQERFLAELFSDMVGFAGAKIIRRIFGFAHNADFELIADRTHGPRPRLEAVRLARLFLLEPERFRTPADIVIEARARRHGARLHRRPAGDAR